MTDDDPIVVFIASRPEVFRRLLAEHVDDGTGHCRVCAIGNQAGYLRFPCNIAGYVTRASRVSPPGPEPSPGPLAAPGPTGECLPGAPRPRAPRVVRAGSVRRANDITGPQAQILASARPDGRIPTSAHSLRTGTLRVLLRRGLIEQTRADDAVVTALVTRAGRDALAKWQEGTP